jgi:hypothetical protein
VRLERLGKLKNVMTSSEIEPANFRIKIYPELIRSEELEKIYVAQGIVPVARSCEHGNEPSGPVKGIDFGVGLSMD